MFGLPNYFDRLPTPSNANSGSNSNKGSNSKQMYVIYNKQKYPVLIDGDGNYYFLERGQKKVLTNQKDINNLKKGYSSTASVPVKDVKDANSFTTSVTNNTQNNSNTNKPPQNSGSGGGGYLTRADLDLAIQDAIDAYIKETTPPKVKSAEEAADIYGIDYNLSNILKEYNDATNKYYDDLITEQNKDRTWFTQQTNNYANRITKDYLDSTTNAAQTATGRGTTAANTLSTDLYNQATANANDLGMLQAIENSNESRKAELENNPLLAEQYYNKMGTYLSSLATNLYASDVKKYVDELDAYAQTYAADRSLAASAANAAASKYAGLANAALYGAQGASANKTSNWQKYYNYYFNQFGNPQAAANAVESNILMGGVR